MGLESGDPYEIFVSFDAPPQDQIPQSDDWAAYPATGFRVELPGGTFVGELDDPSNIRVTVRNDHPPFVDDEFFISILNTTVLGEFEGAPASLDLGIQALVTLSDRSASWIDDDALPSSFLPIDQYDVASLQFFYMTVDGQTTGQLSGFLQEAVVVPEPQSSLLLGLSLAWLNRFGPRQGRESKTRSEVRSARRC